MVEYTVFYLEEEGTYQLLIRLPGHIRMSEVGKFPTRHAAHAYAGERGWVR